MQLFHSKTCFSYIRTSEKREMTGEEARGCFFGLLAKVLILGISDKLESGFFDFSGGTSEGLSEVYCEHCYPYSI